MQAKFTGKFIVFEGGEGAGKTTQIQRSRDWLLHSRWFEHCQTYGQAQGFSPQIFVTRQPGGTELGLELRQLLLNRQFPIQSTTELMLYAADRAQHVEEILKPKMADGAIILCDRFTDSTIAYQGYGRGLDLNLIQQLNQIATGGLTSDLTFWLDLDVELGLNRAQQRSASDRLEKAELAFHQRVYQGYQELAQTFPQRIVRIDASLSETEVSAQIQSILEERFQQWYPLLSVPF